MRVASSGISGNNACGIVAPSSSNECNLERLKVSFLLPHQIITAPPLSSAQPLRQYELAHKDTAAGQRERSGALSLAALAPASSPRSVALTQLPSPSTLSIGDITWYTDLLETPSLAQGTYTPLHYAHAGRTKAVNRSWLACRFSKLVSFVFNSVLSTFTPLVRQPGYLKRYTARISWTYNRH